MNWHNSYNAIPTVRASQKNNAYFADQVPESLDHLPPESISGIIDIDITVRSATVVGQRDAQGRVVIPSASGKPNGAQNFSDAVIPATSIKGMLSSAYEAVTESRLRVFGNHSYPVTFRRHAQEATNLIPTFLRYTKTDQTEETQDSSEDQCWTATLMIGLNKSSDIKAIGDGTQKFAYAAYLPDAVEAGVDFLITSDKVVHGGFRIDPDDPRRDKKVPERRSEDAEQHVNTLLEATRRTSQHLTEIEFCGYETDFFDKQRLVVARVGDSEELFHPKDFNASTNLPHRGLRGHVVRLTPQHKDGKLSAAQRLIDRKYSEFIFFNTDSPIETKVDNSLLTILIEVIRASSRFALDGSKSDKLPTNITIHKFVKWYRAKEKTEDPKKMIPSRDEVREFIEIEAASFPGIPLFSTIDVSKNRNVSLTSFALSTVGRTAMIRSRSPECLARHADKKAGKKSAPAQESPQSIFPSQMHSSASPADRLWGFAPRAEGDSGSALRGRITLTNATPDIAKTKGSGLRIASRDGLIALVLSSPKVTASQFYLRDGGGQALKDSVTHSKSYLKGQTLIRKTYPTHRFLTARGVDRQHRISDQLRTNPGRVSSKVETTIGSYLTPGATFHAQLRYSGLSEVELAILMWLLTPTNLVPSHLSHSTRRGYQHIGLGKPYGWGSIEIRGQIRSASRGKEVADGYMHLKSVLGGPSTKLKQSSFTGDYRSALPNEFRPNTQSAAVRAFVRSCFGWEDYHAAGNTDTVSYSPYSTGDPSPIIRFHTEAEEQRLNDGPLTYPIRDLAEDNPSGETTVPESYNTPTKAKPTPPKSAVPTTPKPAVKPGPALFPRKKK